MQLQAFPGTPLTPRVWSCTSLRVLVQQYSSYFMCSPCMLRIPLSAFKERKLLQDTFAYDDALPNEQRASKSLQVTKLLEHRSDVEP